ncbi:MAG: hypothetical protein JWO36_5651 [Myxococcales bacterium]|nr:hypothetical protein [Myxococcales bacterium]
MRNFLLLSLLVGASACAARAPQTTIPVQYACGDSQVVREGDRLSVNRPQNDDALRPASLGWHDDDGDHFVTWPLSATDVQAVEYVVPNDRRSDAVERVYDTSKGVSTADWRLTKRQVCTAHGGYSDALARWMKGADIDQLASELSVDHEAARGLVHTALTALQHRYYKDR